MQYQINGTLLFKCELCGKITTGEHVPNGVFTLLILKTDPNLRSALGEQASILSNFSVHHCKDGRIGSSKLVGLQPD